MLSGMQPIIWALEGWFYLLILSLDAEDILAHACYM
jgi:hypothetical protein